MLVSYLQIADHVSKNPDLIRQWETAQTVEKIKTKISLASFKEIETIRSETQYDLELLNKAQKQTVEETLDKQLKVLEAKEKLLLDALDAADGESEVNNTYCELSMLADLGYVRMAELGHKMSERSALTLASTASLRKMQESMSQRQNSGYGAGLTSRSEQSTDEL